MEKIVNKERWRGPARIACFAFSAIALNYAFMFDSHIPKFGSEQNIVLHFLPVMALFTICIILNLKMPTMEKQYVETVEINSSSIKIKQLDARTIWQRANVAYFELPISAIESAKLVFQDFGESSNAPHISISIHTAPIGCPKTITLYSNEASVAKFIEFADRRFRAKS